MDISEIDSIKTKLDFMVFLGGMAEDFRDNKGEWQCDSIDRFLEACAAWLMNAPSDETDWELVDYKTIAKILFMGKFFE